MALTEEQEMLLMAYADGELTGDSLAEAEALVAVQAVAQVAVHDLRLAALALQRHVLSDELEVSADLSRIRGRVLTKIPAPARAIAAQPKTTLWGRLFGWTRHFDAGQIGVAGGVAMAALLFAVVLTQDRTTATQALVDQASADGALPTAGSRAETAVAKAVLPAAREPSVIIEDMELDGGTVLIEGAEEPGETMIIWHMQPDGGEAG